MKPIERFTLETHDGPYETWPSRTHARVNGERCGLTVSGYVLLRQFETPDAYLLVTDYDCLFEEAVTFTLVSKDPLKALARRTVGAMYTSCHLDDMRGPTTGISARRSWASTDGGISRFVTDRFRSFCLGSG
ncbi:hypothetical protein [Burkholderia contaminans]|uniref:hypothetical protein n=1 Tax=Burkholderia contaminans TaxID=488447 RepID=UPI001FC89B63|nr:hypothetical protein [Burkholderia contaminans]